MPSYGFCFRASVRKGGGAGKLYLRVIHGGRSRSITSRYRILPEEWDSDGRHLIIPYDHSERARQLTAFEAEMLNDIRRMEGVVKQLEGEGDYDIDELIERYRAVMTGNSLRVWADKLVQEMIEAGSPRTAQAYQTTARRVRLFNGGREVKAEHITAGFISDFQAALKAEGKSPNTISFYMRNLRAIYNKAIAEGRVFRHADNPFANAFTGVSPTRKLALSPDELTLLADLNPVERVAKSKTTVRQEPELLSPALKQALAMFLFSYHARGMCFVDMAYLRKSDLRGDVIRYRRHKTRQIIEIGVQPAMRRIIEWLAPLTAGSEYLFPIIVDADKDSRVQYETGLRLQNSRLKRIASIAGIRKPVSTHCARHSWATVAKNEGLPLMIISEGLGHTNQKTTEIYLASLERSVLDQASKVVSQAISPSWAPKKGRRNLVGNNYQGGVPGYMAYGGVRSNLW